MFDWLDQIVLENEVWRWLLFGVLILFGILLSKTISYGFTVLINRFTRKSRWVLDDLVATSLHRPLAIAILATAIYSALGLLSFGGAAITANVFISGVYAFTITILIVYVIAKLYGDLLLHFLKKKVVETDTKLDDQLLPLAVKGGRFIIWSFGLMLALSNAHIDVTSLIAGLGIGGLALAMAAQDTVKNVFGGASIFADRPFEIGDTITIKGTSGAVEEIGVRTTRLRTFEDTVFILPNSAVADSPIENLSSRRRRKRSISLGLTYGTTAKQIGEAKRIIGEIAKSVGDIEDTVVRFDNFGASALELSVTYWVTDMAAFFDKVDLFNTQILERFETAKLSLAFPTQTVHLVKA